MPVSELLHVLGVCATVLTISMAVILIISFVHEPLTNWRRRRQDRRSALIEAELDRTEAELRQTILQLASALSGDALEARKALIRESYLSRGEVPKE